MWILIPNGKTEPEYWLNPGRTYTIGRKDCDIVLEDKSVSRNHAELKIDLPSSQKKIQDLDYQVSIQIKDLSRFGTSINDKPCKKNEFEDLNENDLIKFGTSETGFTLKILPLVFCFSNMRSKQKLEAVQFIGKLGAHLTDSCEKCTHLLMNEVRITTKSLLIVAQAKPIVSNSWIQSVLERSDPKLPLPNVNSHLPNLGPELNDRKFFEPNESRKSLFKDKHFLIFMNEQFEKISNIIEAAGGTPVIYSKNVSFEEEYICIEPNPEGVDEKTKRYVQSLKKKGIRFVEEDDIPNAVLQMDDFSTTANNETEEDSKKEIVKLEKTPQKSPGERNSTSPAGDLLKKNEGFSPFLSIKEKKSQSPHADISSAATTPDPSPEKSKISPLGSEGKMEKEHWEDAVTPRKEAPSPLIPELKISPAQNIRHPFLEKNHSPQDNLELKRKKIDMEDESKISSTSKMNVETKNLVSPAKNTKRFKKAAVPIPKNVFTADMFS